jgi:hypothetical protein
MFTIAKNRPTLSDPAGTDYPLQDTVDLAPVELGGKASSYPTAVGDVVLGFAMPPAGWQSLRLAVPASAWDGTGTYRFTIPATMLAPRRASGVQQQPINGR